MIFFKKKKELVKQELESFDQRFVVKTPKGEFKLFLCEKDIYCKGSLSKDSRYGLAFIKDIDIGTELVYHNPRLERKVNMGRIKSIVTN
ncbi:hypothetical protein CL616_01210 [archaeon]|nr:hypothetical protein [archaeon]|tara:strand:+ start:642 stop:908 length:267 start_codon:yes stop_codon:yes gene_type:complete